MIGTLTCNLPADVCRATGKSAQIPLYRLVPDAMEGPHRSAH